MESQTILECKDLVFNGLITYPNISIKENQQTFIQGESGIGKSVFLKMINGILNPSQGQILYRGMDIWSYDILKYRQEVLLISQKPYLFPGTIEENFNIYYKYRQKELLTKEKMIFFLKLCCGDFSLDKKTEILSGGEKSRDYMAIFISFNPRIIMLDEPTAALDEKTAELLIKQIFNYFKEMQITSITISHDPKITEKFADTIELFSKEGSVG